MFVALHVHLHPQWLAWTDSMVLTWSGVIGLFVFATASAIFFGNARQRRLLGAAMLAAMSIEIALGLAGFRVPILWPDFKLSVLIAVLLAIAAAGVVVGWRSARWLALALAHAGLIGGFLEFLYHFESHHYAVWLLGSFSLGSAVLISNLVGADVRALDRRRRDDLWQSREPIVAWLRFATLSALLAALMLVVYAWAQPVALEVPRRIAPWLALWFACSAIATIRGRTVGVLMLAVGGLVLLILNALMWASAMGQPNSFLFHATGYYATTPCCGCRRR
jgi:hypothetical protein